VNQIQEFLNNPFVAGIYGVLVLALIDFALGIYRSIQGGVFDWQKLPKILDSVVLQKVIPLAALGVAGYFMTDQATKSVLLVAYSGLVLTVLAAEVNSLIKKITGAYEPTTVKGINSAGEKTNCP
jgi:hypothetical protein